MGFSIFSINSIILPYAQTNFFKVNTIQQGSINVVVECTNYIFLSDRTRNVLANGNNTKQDYGRLGKISGKTQFNFSVFKDE